MNVLSLVTAVFASIDSLVPGTGHFMSGAFCVLAGGLLISTLVPSNSRDVRLAGLAACSGGVAFVTVLWDPGLTIQLMTVVRLALSLG